MRSMTKRSSHPLTLGIAILALTACQTPTNTSAELDLEAFADLMVDNFETAADDPKNNFADQRARITSAALPGVWIYYQLNTGPERKLYRQRIIGLSVAETGDAIVQKTFGLNDPDRFINAWDNPGLLSSVTREDFDPYFESGCDQVWRPSAEGGWRGYVDPASCKIFSERRQAEISIEAEARLNAETYQQTERGYDENGVKLFGGDPGEFIVLYRE